MTKTARGFNILSALALVLLLGSLVAERWRTEPGLRQMDIGLDAGVPATLYFQDPIASAIGVRPGIVMAHGYGGDRATMDGLARSLALSGYSVVSIDESGHGMNRNPFHANFGRADEFVSDIKAGVAYLRGTLRLESSQIAVVGHSMGARAALAYGTHEKGAAGLVIISGSSTFVGPQRPANALFLYADRDLPGLEASIKTVSAKLADVAQPENGKTYGDFALGTAVRNVRVPHTGHGTILSSEVAFHEILDWLDRVTGQPEGSEPRSLVLSPLGPPLLWLSFFLVLPGLGRLLSHVAPMLDEFDIHHRRSDFGLLALALLLPLVMVAAIRPGVLMDLSDADTNVTHLTYGGILLLTSLVLVGRLHRVPRPWLGSLMVAMVGWLAVGALLGPVSAHFHGVGLTPEKAMLFFWTAVCLLPFALGFQLVLRRDRWWHGALLRLGGRLAVLIAVVFGNALGVFSFPGTIAIFVLLAALVIVEPILAGFYTRSRNFLAAGGLDAIVTGWLFALFLPSNF